MRLSTRNQLPGTVSDVEVGTVMTVVKVSLDDGGQHVVAAITKDAAEELGIRPGAKVTVLVKATEVMLAVE
jgi:molybdopterin-binding protein